MFFDRELIMNKEDGRFPGHYGAGASTEELVAALERSSGKDRSALTSDDFAVFDEFHIGGRRATALLLEKLGLAPGMYVLDIGSGIGGAARYAAASCGVRAEGVDVTPAFCETAAALSRLARLEKSTAFHVGTALALPFPDTRFDAAWTIHTAMNVRDKKKMYEEAFRILVPGGRFGLYDVMAGPGGGDPAYPVPWASSGTESFLETPPTVKTLLEEAGFEILESADMGAFAGESLGRLSALLEKSAPDAPGLHLVMGDDWKVRLSNLRRNIRDGLCLPWLFVCRRPQTML